MKNIIAILLCCTLILSLSSAAFAQGETAVTISSAVEDSGVVTVKANIANAVSEQYITVVACEYQGESYVMDSPESIVYIDQFQPEIDENNSFSFSFKYAAWAEAEKLYYLRIGGTNAATADGMLIVASQGGEVTVIYGDADMDKIITASDSLAVLAKVLDDSFKLKIENTVEDYATYIDINGNGVIDVLDAAAILLKTLNSSYSLAS